MQVIEIYGQKNCLYCDKAKEFSSNNNFPFVYRDIENVAERQEMLRRNPSAQTVPQIFIGDTLVGGFLELSQTPIHQIQQMIGE